MYYRTNLLVVLYVFYDRTNNYRVTIVNLQTRVQKKAKYVIKTRCKIIFVADLLTLFIIYLLIYCSSHGLHESISEYPPPAAGFKFHHR